MKDLPLIDDLLAALAEAELVAWALSHGFEFDWSSDVDQSKMLWRWFDEDGNSQSSELLEPDYSDLPPLTDEVREAILKQKEQK